MRLYKVSMNADFGNTDGRSAWTSRKAELPRLKRELREAASGGAWVDPEVEVVEFEATVQGIVEMLNRHAARG